MTTPDALIAELRSEQRFIDGTIPNSNRLCERAADALAAQAHENSEMRRTFGSHPLFAELEARAEKAKELAATEMTHCKVLREELDHAESALAALTETLREWKAIARDHERETAKAEAALRQAVPRERAAQILGELAGSASLCWNPKPTGEFDSNLASKFVDDALAAMYDVAPAAASGGKT